jgi:hypothetical protein
VTQTPTARLQRTQLQSAGCAPAQAATSRPAIRAEGRSEMCRCPVRTPPGGRSRRAKCVVRPPRRVRPATMSPGTARCRGLLGGSARERSAGWRANAVSTHRATGTRPPGPVPERAAPAEARPGKRARAGHRQTT